jgi:hypothetical protein
MKRLRHPIRAIREPFGTAGLIVACIALIAAVGGTAWAASGLNAKQKKEVTKIAKKYAGKPGAPGAAGPAGTNGTNGKDGANGTNGASAAAVSFTGSKTVGSVTCTEGGLEITSASGTSLVCNGKKGPQGLEGEPGEPGPQAPLQSGKTETGTWAIDTVIAEENEQYIFPISFNVPLENPLDSAHALYAGGSGNGAGNGCPGSDEDPSAEPGFLCVYVEYGAALIESPVLLRPDQQFPALGAGDEGAVMHVQLFSPTPANIGEHNSAFGTWAVTAE